MAEAQWEPITSSTFQSKGKTTSTLKSDAGWEPAPSKVADSRVNFKGTVTEVHDGDSVTVKDEDGKTHKVRLAGIDAPEVEHPPTSFLGRLFSMGGAQSNGHESRDYLSKKLLNQEVNLGYSKIDEHGRKVGYIEHNGKDVNLDMIASGNAHHYSRFDNDKTYADAWTKAQQDKIGMWGSKDQPTDPEKYRQKQEDPMGWERVSKHPGSAVAADVVAVAGGITGLPKMIAEATSNLLVPGALALGEQAGVIKHLTGKQRDAVAKATGEKLSKDFGLDKLAELPEKAAVAIGLDKETLQGAGLNTLMKLANKGVEWVGNEAETQSGGRVSSQQMQAAINLGLLKAGDALHPITSKINDKIIEAGSKITTSDVEAARNKKVKMDADFKEYQDIMRAKQPGPPNPEDFVVDEDGVVTPRQKVEPIEPSTPLSNEAVKNRPKTVQPLAGTNRNGEIILNHEAIKEDFENDFTYMFDGLGVTGQQKQIMAERMGLTREKMRELIPDVETYIEFLKAHEESHVINSDREKYPRTDKGKWDYLHEDALAIEQRATEDGFKALEGFQKSKEPKHSVHTDEGYYIVSDYAMKKAEAGYFTDNPHMEGYKDPVTGEPFKPHITNELLNKHLPEWRDQSYFKGTPKPLDQTFKTDFKTYFKSKEGKKEYEATMKRTLESSNIDMKPFGGNVFSEKSGMFRQWQEMVKDSIGATLGEHLEASHEVKNFAEAIRKAIPSKSDRELVFDAIQRKTVDKLPAHLKFGARKWESVMDSWGETFMKAGTLKGMLEGYASRIVDLNGEDPSVLAKVMQDLAGSEQGPTRGGTTSRFAKGRTIADYDKFLAAVEQAGMKLKTRDLAEVAEIYGNSMFKASLNKTLIDGLKTIRLKEGFKVLIDKSKPGAEGYKPNHYVDMKGGMFENYAVHPDIADAMKFIMDAKDMNLIMRGISLLSSSVKRMNVGLSLFHNTTLLVGSAFVNSVKTNSYFNPVAHYKKMAEAYDKGWQSGRLQTWLKDGIGLSPEADAGVGVFHEMAASGDNFIKHFGGFEGSLLQKTVDIAGKPQRLLDKITWDITHNGSKLLTADALLEQSMKDHPNVPEADLRKEIVRHVNNIYGGIDWFDAARSTNKYMEKMKMTMFNPEGRKIFQILEFAPDWTLSILRNSFDSLPKDVFSPSKWDIGQGFAGLVKPLTATDYARRYQIRALMYLFTVANALNISLSGHGIEDNKDMFSIETGDGRAIHPFKHYAEQWKWVQEPMKEFVNKLGFVPKLFAKTDGKGFEDTAKEAFKSALPFSAGGVSKGALEAIGGFAGAPVTGDASGQGISGKGIASNWHQFLDKEAAKLGINVEHPYKKKPKENEWEPAE